MKLWLDDVRPAPEGWTWVKTAWDAIALLEKGGVEAVSLDHDLGDPENGTGQFVANWIEAEAYHRRLGPIGWRVHSANPIGAERMKITLERAETYWNERRAT